MNTDLQTGQTRERLHAFINEVVNPPGGTKGPGRRILLARQLAAVGGTVATLIQIVVWLLIAVFSGHLDSPWWLWTAAPALAAVGALTVIDRWPGDDT